MASFNTWLNHLWTRIDQGSLPPIPYVGSATGRILNPPAPHIEICLVTEGGFEEIRIGDLAVALPKRTVSFHNVHFGNYGPSGGKTRSWCIFFEVARLPEFRVLAERPVFESAAVQDPMRVVRAFRNVAARAGTGFYPSAAPVQSRLPEDPGLNLSALYLKAAVIELLAVLFEETGIAGGVMPPLDPLPVRQAEDFMGRHYEDPRITRADIGSATNLSEAHFARLFVQSTGTTPMRRLKAIRISHAQTLLTLTNLRVGEIASNVGFTDPFHFSRTFRALVGMSPRAYRVRNAVAAKGRQGKNGYSLNLRTPKAL